MLGMTLKSGLMVTMVLAGLLSASVGQADGIVQNASKDVAKGAIKGLQQEMNSPGLVNSAKQVTKGMVDGMADAAPLVTSQVANQANLNRKAIGNVARQVTVDAAAGMMGVTMHEMKRELGAKGDGPMADTVVALSERMTTANIRALASELRPDPATVEKLTAASVRGAMSEMNFNFHLPVWPLALAFALGGLSTLLCGVGLMLLYILFQRRRDAVPVPVPVAGTARIQTGQPLLTTP